MVCTIRPRCYCRCEIWARESLAVESFNFVSAVAICMAIGQKKSWIDKICTSVRLQVAVVHGPFLVHHVGTKYIGTFLHCRQSVSTKV
jgi:hypothetical protein